MTLGTHVASSRKITVLALARSVRQTITVSGTRSLIVAVATDTFVRSFTVALSIIITCPVVGTGGYAGTFVLTMITSVTFWTYTFRITVVDLTIDLTVVTVVTVVTVGWQYTYTNSTAFMRAFMLARIATVPPLAFAPGNSAIAFTTAHYVIIVDWAF
tara:strand:+ start:175 stop:648 length:474 start_codon:yes stop_codon:yes gene_type:complete